MTLFSGHWRIFLLHWLMIVFVLVFKKKFNLSMLLLAISLNLVQFYCICLGRSFLGVYDLVFLCVTPGCVCLNEFDT